MSLESRTPSEISVHLLREGLTESIHHAQAVVADQRGRTLAVAGQGTSAFFVRSGLKPFQACAMLSTGIREQFSLSEKDLATLCSSHDGSMPPSRQVFAMLWRANLEPEHLMCPVPADCNSTLCHNCSGKHAGMLMACRSQNWSLHDYPNRHHPAQMLVRDTLSELLHMPADELLSARDDCGVPTYQLQLDQIASLYAQLTSGQRADLEMVSRAMTRHPQMVAGSGRFDTELMLATQGELVCKSGAEGIQCIGRNGEGLGLAIKVTDGSGRAKVALAIHLLQQLGWISPAAAELLSEKFTTVGSYCRLEVEGELRLL